MVAFQHFLETMVLEMLVVDFLAVQDVLDVVFMGVAHLLRYIVIDPFVGIQVFLFVFLARF